MGIDFRGKGYVKRVKIGKRTVKHGEAAAVWDQYGRHHQVVGPARVRLWWATIRFLDRFVAGKDEYLRIRHTDGTVEHVKGPTAIFENPVFHLGVSVEQAMQLQSPSQHVVVHRDERGGAGAGNSAEGPSTLSTASKMVLTGPAIFFPEVSDTLHLFMWPEEAKSGEDETAKGKTPPWKPTATKFCEVLSQGGRVLDTECRMTQEVVCDLRGSDGLAAKVAISLQVQIVGVQEALKVANPIAECKAIVGAAVADVASAMRFNDRSKPLASALRAALAEPAFHKRLEDLLLTNAACHLLAAGLKDVSPSKELEKLLRQEDELAAQHVSEQKADAVLEAAAARQQKEHELEAAKQKHALVLAAERDAAESKKVEGESKRAIAFLQELKATGADVTKYLEAQALAQAGKDGRGAATGLGQGAKGAKAAGGMWW